VCVCVCVCVCVTVVTGDAHVRRLHAALRRHVRRSPEAETVARYLSHAPTSDFHAFENGRAVYAAPAATLNSRVATKVSPFSLANLDGENLHLMTAMTCEH